MNTLHLKLQKKTFFKGTKLLTKHHCHLSVPCCVYCRLPGTDIYAPAFSGLIAEEQLYANIYATRKIFNADVKFLQSL